MEIGSVNLWSTSIFVTNLGLDEDFINNLASFLTDLKNIDNKNITASNVGGWHSDYSLFQHENEENKLIHKKVSDTITWIYSQNNTSFFDSNRLVMNSWGNINSGHTYQSFHTHAEWALSAVFYVKVPEVEENSRNGAIAFQDFSSRSVNPNIKDLKNILGERVKFLKVKQSDLVIFPSYLPHAVQPTYVEDPRITIAFNYLAVPK
jgi:uncharacterized protein (TIGR02466 family)